MNNPRIPYQKFDERNLLSPPDGKSLIVHLVVNVEQWLFQNPMPRKILTAPHNLELTPDIPNYSWAEYGMRCGMPRLLKCFSERELPASVSLNAGVINPYKKLADAMLDAGWEFIAHGVQQESMQGTTDEASVIHQSISLIEEFTGSRPQGWLSPGLKETVDTPDILKAEGVRYVFEWVLDDLPCWMKTKNGPLISMPYTLELNDSVVYAIEKHSSPELCRRLEDTLTLFDRQMKKQPRVLTLGLHPHLIGVPHRFPYLERMLDLLQSRSDTVFMTGKKIADWFETVEPSSKEPNLGN